MRTPSVSNVRVRNACWLDAYVNRYASMEVDHRGKVWIIDDYSGKRVFTHETVWGGRWRGFSHGGTLRSLVEAFRDYICTGEPLNRGYLGPERFDDSNIWGYDEAGMKAVREQAGALPVFLPKIKILERN